MADITYPYLPAAGDTLTAAGLNGNLYSTTPATSIHQTANGLPIGVQIAAPLGGEAVLVRIAAQLERAMPWIGRKPKVLAR